MIHYKKSTRASDFTDLASPSPLETEKGEDERKAAQEVGWMTVSGDHAKEPNVKQELKRWESTRDEWTEEVKYEPHLDWRNTLTKFGLDQTLGALVNTIIFVGGMAGLRGEGWDGAVMHIRQVN